jgi:hypothetical protein
MTFLENANYSHFLLCNMRCFHMITLQGTLLGGFIFVSYVAFLFISRMITGRLSFLYGISLLSKKIKTIISRIFIFGESESNWLKFTKDLFVAQFVC